MLAPARVPKTPGELVRNTDSRASPRPTKQNVQGQDPEALHSNKFSGSTGERQPRGYRCHAVLHSKNSLLLPSHSQNHAAQAKMSPSPAPPSGCGHGTKGTSDQRLATLLGHSGWFRAVDPLRTSSGTVLLGCWEGRPRLSTEILGKTGGELKAARDKAGQEALENDANSEEGRAKGWKDTDSQQPSLIRTRPIPRICSRDFSKRHDRGAWRAQESVRLLISGL